jgi:ribosomal protein S18 acetylase RimI-like enzyme
MVTLPASAFSPAALVDCWNLGYAGYFVPLRFDEGALARHFGANDIDLERSVVIRDGEAFVGFSFLGVRGRRGWIGGFGVAPAYRGRGLARLVMEEHLGVIRRAGLDLVQLEVLTQNWAQKVYARAGFAVTRRLVKLEGSLPEAGAAATAELADRRAHLEHHARLHAAFPAPWQREPPSLEAIAAPMEVLRVGPAAAPSGTLMITEEPGRLKILDGAALGPDEARTLVAALAARRPEAKAAVQNEPEGSPLHEALLAAGLEETLAQYEMCWRPG